MCASYGMSVKPRRIISSAESAIQQRPGWSKAEPWYELGTSSSNARHVHQAKEHEPSAESAIVRRSHVFIWTRRNAGKRTLGD